MATIEIFKDGKGQIRTQFVDGKIKSGATDAIYETVGQAFDDITTRSTQLGVKVDVYVAKSAA